MNWKALMLTLVSLYVAATLRAQTSREQYITFSGDTVTVYTKVKIEFSANSIYPNFKPSDGIVKVTLAKRFLAYEMEGNTYSIYRLIKRRVPNGEIRQIAEILIRKKSIHPTESQVYWIEIDQAIREGAISLIH